MSTRLQTFLVDLVKNYNGGKLKLLATGGGLSMAVLGTIPGSSRIFNTFFAPYSTTESSNFLFQYAAEGLARITGCSAAQDFNKKAVSATVAANFLIGLENQTIDVYTHTKVDEFKHVVVTASLISDRYRRGDNKAFIAFNQKAMAMPEVWELKFPKLTEAQHLSKTILELAQIRQFDDETIAIVALSLACGVSHPLVKELKDNGSLARISL